jgi:hypothetical protein
MILQALLLAFGATLLILSIRRLRQYRLKERHTLLFLVTGLPFLVLAIWPNGLGWLALRMGIEYSSLALLLVAAFLILMVFELLTIVSLQDRRIATLAQIVGIMMEKNGLNDREPGTRRQESATPSNPSAQPEPTADPQSTHRQFHH